MKDMISVIVITYNSEKWVIETLNSIKKQTYKLIELIITDDNSTDNTILIVEEWIKKNKERFIDIKIRRSEKNEGVTANINNGIKLSTGKWIKLIAGDDILLKKCIEKNINCCLENNYSLLFSKVIRFKDKLLKKNILRKNKDEYKNFNRTANEQFKVLLKENFISAPTSFFKKELLVKMNYFDETYPMVEDYPMWLKLTENNIKLNFLDEYTVFYRIHGKSISNNNNQKINERMLNFRKELYKNYIRFKIKNPLFHFSEKLMYIRADSIIKNGNKNRTFICYLTYIIDTYFIFNKLKFISKKLIQKI